MTVFKKKIIKPESTHTYFVLFLKTLQPVIPNKYLKAPASREHLAPKTMLKLSKALQHMQTSTIFITNSVKATSPF